MEVYLDNSATTKCYESVKNIVGKVMCEDYGNPSSMHKKGVDAEKYVKESKETLARILKVQEKELYFTSGGNEANNWAIKGIAKANRAKGNHIISSQIEHPSVLESCRELEKEGFKVTYVPVDENGVVDYASIIKAIGPNTILISIMTANHEVGSLQPVRAIAELAKQNEVYFHTDAIQAVGSVNLNVKELGVDALSISAHKINGPKGVGALYIKKGTKINKFMSGGKQENDLRAGTANVPACAGFGVAIENATTDLEDKVREVRVLRKYFQKRVSEAIHNIALNGHPTQRLANNCSITFEGAEAEAVVMLLDKEGICASMGSTSEFGSNAPSHVLAAMGKDSEAIRSTVRFTLGADLTREEIDDIVETLRKTVKKVRSVSAIRIYKNKVEL